MLIVITVLYVYAKYCLFSLLLFFPLLPSPNPLSAHVLTH